MNAQVKFYQSGFAGEAPEIYDHRKAIKVKDKKKLIEYALSIKLSESVEYVHIYVDDEPIIAVTRHGIRDVEECAWIVEPEDNEE